MQNDWYILLTSKSTPAFIIMNEIMQLPWPMHQKCDASTQDKEKTLWTVSSPSELINFSMLLGHYK